MSDDLSYSHQKPWVETETIQPYRFNGRELGGLIFFCLTAWRIIRTWRR